MIVKIISFALEQRILDPAYFENAADALEVAADGTAKRCTASIRFTMNGVELDGIFYLSPQAQVEIEALLAKHIAAAE